MVLFIQIFDSTSKTLHITRAACDWNHTELYHKTEGQPNLMWVVSLAVLKRGVWQRDLPGFNGQFN